MIKVRRNDPCPCGSTLKYKKCCGSYGASELTFDRERELAMEQAFRRAEAARAQREKQHGLGRGIVSTALSGYRIVAVGNTVYTSKEWRTFHDFLRDYLIGQLGGDWFKSEMAKDGLQQHPIVRWFTQAVGDRGRLKRVGEIYIGPMTGAQRAFVNLAYNIYLIAHHAEPNDAPRLVARHSDFDSLGVPG